MSAVNLEQQEAIETATGPVAIIAGPGSGKTKTLVDKVTYLVNKKNVFPASILILTFTKKAAGEIKTRLADQLKNPKDKICVGTFHSLCFNILNEQNLIKDKKIITELQRKIILRKVIASSLFLDDLSIRELGFLISRYKAEPVSQKNPTQRDLTKQLEKLCAKYNKFLQEENLLDFDDLLLTAFKLLKENQLLRKVYQNRYKFVLIDEFQDTNFLQYELIKLILNQENNITVIGDPRQAIYGFRGSSGDIFGKFKSDFKKTKEIYLKTNYRNPAKIIKLSQKIFDSFTEQSSVSKETGKVSLVETYNHFSEAEFVVNKIASKLGGLGLLDSSNLCYDQDETADFADFAVLYRTHSLSHSLQQKFRASGIPFQVVGRGSFYEQKEVDSIIEYLREDEKLLLKTEESLPLSVLVKNFIKAHHLEEKLKDKPEKLINLLEFENTLLNFDQNKNAVKSFLNYYDQIAEQDFYDQGCDKVTLMSMHSAKGLEFKYVFLIGFEENLLPFTKKETDIEEEKRLFFVALTRVKKELDLLFTQSRFGQKAKISPFSQLLRKDEVEFILDKKIDNIKKKIAKTKAKKNQLKLF